MKNKVIAIVIMIFVFLVPVRIGFLSDDLPSLKFIAGMVLTIVGTYGAMFLFNIKEKKEV